MLRQKAHHQHSANHPPEEDDALLDPSSAEEEVYRHRSPRDAPGISGVNVNVRSATINAKADTTAAAAGPYNKGPVDPSPSSSSYTSQAYGYAHPYHPPPQYNTPPPPHGPPGHGPPPPYSHYNPHQQAHHRGINLSGGIHYSYLILIALAFATVVQISKGGLFAYNANQRAQFVYPVPMQNPNLRPGGGFNGYYGGNMMMMNGNGNGMNAQQGQDTSDPSTAAGAEAVPEAVPAGAEAAPAPAEEAAPVDAGGDAAPIAKMSLDSLSNFANNWDEWQPTDTPVFFHIPKAGGSTIKDIIGTCHRFVMATEAGITDGHADDTEVAIVYPGGGPKGVDRSPFVNVDTTTVAGIQRAKDLGFADAGLADAVVTPFIYEANDLFTPTAKGRLFTVFRHPIDRAISLFYYLQVADWEPTYDPELKNWSIKEYAQSDRIENNWLTRQLSNTLAGELHDEDLDLAMEVVRSKFLVGLMSEIKTTMERCERFYRWKYHVNPPNQEKCRSALLSGGSNSNAKNKKDKPQPGSEDYELLAWQNQYDIKLYEYIEKLFVEQEQFVAEIPKDFRNIDGTCCKCDPPTFPPEGFECPKAIQF